MLQANVLSTVDTVLGRQPTGWLDWTIDMRNTLVHRADRAMLSYIDARPVRQSVRRLVNLLPRHPRQTDAEAFASGSRRGRRDGMTHLVLQEDTTALMSGTLDCSLALVAELADVLLGTWQKRRADPTLLVQPGQQWKNLWQGPVGTFDGYKPGSITDLGDQIQVPTEMARRMEAAKLLDADQAFRDRLREEDARPEP
ncbi:MAG: hypothetical protein JWN31_840 [Frankiales bacterium]|nr:hypothetical protein [Frankiales bacterium]